MEAICSSETSVDFQRTTWNYIPEDSTFLFEDNWRLKDNIDLFAVYLTVLSVSQTIYNMIYSLASAVFSCNFLSSMFKI
jgi:hypothetical protein